MKVKILLLALSLSFSGLLHSQNTPLVDKRQQKQKKRIANGVKNGELTKKETKKLAKQQANIKRLERKAKKDGTVTLKEKARIQKAQNRASKNIRRKKNNKINR